MLLILVFIAMFVGVPHLLQIIKSNQFLNIPFLNFPRFISTSTPRYFYNKPQPSISQSQYQYQYQYQSQPVGKIRISSVYRYGQGQINLSAAYSGGSIDITGWKIKSVQRGETIIGKGLALPQFTSFLSDIRLKNGDSVKIIAGISPLINNFQVNNCFGWLSNLYNLSYEFNYCPRIEISDLTGLDSSCQDLIFRSTSCRAPSDDILNKQSYQCRIWVEQNLNYNACVKKHMNESDFYKGWQIYTGSNNLLFDQLHDRIELRDQAGLLIDSYEY